LRLDLDFLPSSSPSQPGLVIRDPYRFSEVTLVIPPVLMEALQCFDGHHTDLDLRAILVRVTGDLQVSDLARHMVETLAQAGFLEDETYYRMRDGRKREFAAQPLRQAAHAGSAYPEEPDALRATLSRYMAAGAPAAADGNLVGIAAPHVSPEGGIQAYRAAYASLQPEHRGRTFVILATSHFGEPGKFGLTRKNFATPYGEAQCDRRLVDWLEAHGGSGVEMEDYCHSFEHTAEFQVVFLQHVLGPDVRILPILCGSLLASRANVRDPDDDDDVRAFLDALGELNEREGAGLLWVLGVDMAHMGARYGDRFRAVAEQGEMSVVRTRDQARIERINASDPAGFWDLVRENGDDLKWCGSSPFYTFLKAVPKARGELLHYDQWNIDEQSVVSFAGMAFRG